MHYRRLVGERCYLSPRCQEDLPFLKAWDNDLEVILPASLRGYATPATALYTGSPDASRYEHMFIIVDSATDQPIGWCALMGVDPVNRRAILAILIGEKSYWGQGYGSDACRLLLDHGFNILGLRSVELQVFAFNQRAIRCYEGLGFQTIGRRRQARILAGRAHDVVIMDYLAEEFGESQIAAVVEKTAASGT